MDNEGRASLLLISYIYQAGLLENLSSRSFFENCLILSDRCWNVLPVSKESSGEDRVAAAQSQGVPHSQLATALSGIEYTLWAVQSQASHTTSLDISFFILAMGMFRAALPALYIVVGVKCRHVQQKALWRL